MLPSSYMFGCQGRDHYFSWNFGNNFGHYDNYDYSRRRVPPQLMLCHSSRSFCAPETNPNLPNVRSEWRCNSPSSCSQASSNSGEGSSVVSWKSKRGRLSSPECIAVSELFPVNNWDELTKEIWNKYTTCKQRSETYRKKKDLQVVLLKIIRNVREFMSNAFLYIVGSSINGFGTENSDVDMCLMLPDMLNINQKSDAIDILDVLSRHFAMENCAKHIRLIRAKVPILKFEDTMNNIAVDLNCNNVVGIRNTHLLHCYSSLDWRVKPLVVVVKLWALQQNINDARNMTLSSYSFTLMVIHYLQCGLDPPLLPCLQKMFPEKFSPDLDFKALRLGEKLPVPPSGNNFSLGQLFIGFLDYYGNKFNFSQDAISIRTGNRIPIEDCRYTKSAKNDPFQWKFLCIEEPFDLTNTARSVFDRDMFLKVRNIFKVSYKCLMNKQSLAAVLDYEYIQKNLKAMQERLFLKNMYGSEYMGPANRFNSKLIFPKDKKLCLRSSPAEFLKQKTEKSGISLKYSLSF